MFHRPPHRINQPVQDFGCTDLDIVARNNGLRREIHHVHAHVDRSIRICLTSDTCFVVLYPTSRCAGRWSATRFVQRARQMERHTPAQVCTPRELLRARRSCAPLLHDAAPAQQRQHHHDDGDEDEHREEEQDSVPQVEKDEHDNDGRLSPPLVLVPMVHPPKQRNPQTQHTSLLGTLLCTEGTLCVCYESKQKKRPVYAIGESRTHGWHSQCVI